MATYKIDTYTNTEGDDILEKDDTFDWNGNTVTMPILFKDGSGSDDVLLTKSTSGDYVGSYSEDFTKYTVTLSSFSGTSGNISRGLGLPDPDTGSFTATQQE